MKTPDYPFHPVAELFPLMQGQDFARFKADIAKGQKEPIWLFRGAIIDGRNRYRALKELCMPVQTREWEGEESGLVAFVVSLNLHRRHLDESQRAMVATKLANLAAHRPERTASIEAVHRKQEVRKFADLNDALKPPPGSTTIAQPEAAKLLNVSRSAVQRARIVVEQGSPALVAAVEQGKVAVSAASEVARMPKKLQESVVNAGPHAVTQAAKAAREERQRVEVRRVPQPKRRKSEEPVEVEDEMLEGLKLMRNWRGACDKISMYIRSFDDEMLRSLLKFTEADDRKSMLEQANEVRGQLDHWIKLLENYHA